MHSGFPHGLKLVLDTPDLGGYPLSHQVVCYSASEIGSDVQAVLEEIAECVASLLSSDWRADSVPLTGDALQPARACRPLPSWPN